MRRTTTGTPPTIHDTTLYVGSLYEKVTTPGTSTKVEHKHYIMGPTGRIAVETVTQQNSIENRATAFFHTDGLGSVTAISDEKGTVVKRFAYDAWGKQSTLTIVNPWTQTPVSAIGQLDGFTRGYTDHEMLADFGLIHVNGRMLAGIRSGWA